MRIRTAAAAFVAAAVVAGGTLVATNQGGGPLTGTVDVAFSKGECAGGHFCWVCDKPVDLDLVRINVDDSTIGKDALGLAPGCTGRIKQIDIRTQSEDGIKGSANLNGDVSCSTLSDCVHDLAIDGGTVISTARRTTAPTSHQDCSQWMGGLRITLTHVVFRCSTANNAQFYVSINKQAAVPTPPVDLVCDQCEFHPGTGFHSITLGAGTRVGVSNSLVCPAASQGLQFLVDASVVSPVDVNNVKPWPASSDARCAAGAPPPSTTTAATTTAATTTAPAPGTTTVASPATAAALIASGFTVLRGQATLYAAWKTANPGEAAKLEAYLAGGGAPPVLVTATGRALASFAEAGFLP